VIAAVDISVATIVPVRQTPRARHRHARAGRAVHTARNAGAITAGAADGARTIAAGAAILNHITATVPGRGALRGSGDASPGLTIAGLRSGFGSCLRRRCDRALRRRGLAHRGRRLASAPIATVVVTRLRSTSLGAAGATTLRPCAAAALRPGSAAITLPAAATRTLARTASAVVSLPFAAALLLTAAAVTTGPALALGRTVRRVHERG
jgi:hypothetical protein